jgi:cytochrome c-type biogenesis protein CcsB
MYQVILFGTLIFYALGLLSSLLNFVTKKRALFNAALGLVGAGFVLHTALLILLGIVKRHFPLTNLHETFSFFSWAITLSFFLVYFRYRITALGTFILPLVTTFLLLAGAVWDERKALSPELLSYWRYVHIPLAILAYVAFFVNFISSIMYLLQERELKSKRFSLLYYRLPSLETCDELSTKSLNLGFVLMTLAIITGAFWADAVWGRYWGWDPKECASFTTWTIYFILIHYRWSKGWRGRRAAYISLIGFVFVLFTFLGVPYFKGLHRF